MDHVEDVSGFVDAKLAALEAHASQFESTMRRRRRVPGSTAFRRADPRQRLAEHGGRIGAGAGEVFAAVNDL